MKENKDYKLKIILKRHKDKMMKMKSNKNLKIII